MNDFSFLLEKRLQNYKKKVHVIIYLGFICIIAPPAVPLRGEKDVYTMEPIKPLERINDVNCPQLEYVREFCGKHMKSIRYVIAPDKDARKPYVGVIQREENVLFFVDRYNKRKIPFSKELERYEKSSDISKQLQLYGLDKEKFWYLLLFILDYSRGESIGDVALKSARQELDELFKAVDESKGEMTLTLEIKNDSGQNDYFRVTQPRGLLFLSSLYREAEEKVMSDMQLNGLVWPRDKALMEALRNNRGKELDFSFINEIDNQPDDCLPVPNRERTTLTAWYFYHMLRAFVEPIHIENPRKKARELGTRSGIRTFLDVMGMEILSTPALADYIKGANVNELRENSRYVSAFEPRREVTGKEVGEKD